MPKYVIEREIPGAGKLSREELRAISQRSIDVLYSLGPKIQCVHSYVTDDKLYCVYNAPSPGHGAGTRVDDRPDDGGGVG
jgi:hypothetical protein